MGQRLVTTQQDGHTVRGSRETAEVRDEEGRADSTGLGFTRRSPDRARREIASHHVVRAAGQPEGLRADADGDVQHAADPGEIFTTLLSLNGFVLASHA